MNQSPESKIMTNILEEMKLFFNFSSLNIITELSLQEGTRLPVFAFSILFNKTDPRLSGTGFASKNIAFEIDVKNNIINCEHKNFKYPAQLEGLFEHIKNTHKLS